MKITEDFLKEHNACKDGIKWFKSLKTESIEDIYNVVMKSDNIDVLRNANRGICRFFNKEQKIKYAIFAAEKVLHIFEEKYPSDKRPREAIEAAKKYLKEPSEENRIAAYAADAAADAADAADAAVAARIKTLKEIISFGYNMMGE